MAGPGAAAPGQLGPYSMRPYFHSPLLISRVEVKFRPRNSPFAGLDDQFPVSTHTFSSAFGVNCHSSLLPSMAAYLVAPFGVGVGGPGIVELIGPNW